MIVVKIELWKWGNPEDVTKLGEIRIANDASGDRRVGHYIFHSQKKGGGRWKNGVIKNFPRLRLNAYDLTFRALAAMVGDRNKNVSNTAYVTTTIEAETKA